MKTIVGISCCAIVLLAIGCSSRGSRHHSGYSTPAYSGTVVTTPSSEPPPPPPPPPGPVVSTPPAQQVPGAGAGARGKAFPTREAAVQAAVQIAGAHDKAKVEELFGVGATEVLWSGDDVADKEAALKVKSMIETAVAFDEVSPEESIVEIGKEEWPLPFPLVKTPEGWRFDLEKGKDELLSRRIGRNELETIETLYAYTQAQKEYFSKGRDGNPPAYAKLVRSTAGKQDGLYWETAEGAEPSPLGPFVAEARKAGYGPDEDVDPDPYSGYYFKILTGQGANVSGGRKSYLDDKGLMTKGFAAIAWPANHGNSGIMTFLVNQTGIVFEKDLGKDTERLASAITEYDPDRTWHPTPRQPEIDDDQ